MEQTKNNPEILYLYECCGKHRVYRKTEKNNAMCSRCDKPMQFVSAFPRDAGESEEAWHVRTLLHRRK